MGRIDPYSEDEILVYYLIASFYICLKVEGRRIEGLPFHDFESAISSIPAYRELVHHLAPHLEEL